MCLHLEISSFLWSLVYNFASLVFNDKNIFVQTKITNTLLVGIFLKYKMVLEIAFEYVKSPVFLEKFCICPIFFLIEWFFMISISLFKYVFACSVVYFSSIVSKIWCNSCFAYYVGNLSLIVVGTIRLFYTITIYCLCFLFRNYVYVM